MALAALPDRLPGLDMLRAVAAGTVLVTHLVRVAVLGSAVGAALRPGLSQYLDTSLYAVGAWAVRLFFIVSGLCIHLPMARRLAADRDASLALRPYLLRRFTRIYPPHLIALVASVAVAAALPLALPAEARLVSVPTWPQTAAHLFLVHTFSTDAFNSANKVLWTIAVETQFYLLYPLVLLARRRWSFARIACALVLLSLALGAASALLTPQSAWLVRDSFAARLWEWVLGCWIAERLVARGKRSPVGRLPAASALVASLVAGFALFHLQAGVIAMTWLWPVLLAGAVSLGARVAAAPLSWTYRALSAVGYRSYSLYLTHAIAISGISGLLFSTRLPAAAQAALEVAGSIALCIVFFRWVEQPFLFASRALASRPAAASPAPRSLATAIK